MESLLLIATVTAIHLLAVMSPGPDFMMAVRNSLTYSRKTGIWTAVGFGLGISVHIFYSVAGLAFIISQSILLFSAIKLFGAAYLVFIGIKSLRTKAGAIEMSEQVQHADISRASAVKMGFLTNVLNPKATVFFLSLFTIVLSPNTPAPILAATSAIMVVNTVLWFSLVAVLFTQKKVRSVFGRYQSIFNKTFGGLLVALGIKVALTNK